jgi:uncharacterized protein YecE (DUF72 family)
MIRCGPAGWSYKDWAGIVYPQPKPRGFDPLEYLAAYFETIEVNSTFYRPATAKTGRDWAARVAHRPSFRFSAKLWRRFTHQRGTAWSAAEVREARAGFDPLLEASRLGALLVQFPWSFRRTDENREWLDDLFTAFADFPLVLEVRHESWNTPELFTGLTDRRIGFVNIDQPLFRDSIAPSAHSTAAVGYVRVHGRNYTDWWRSGAAPHERYDYLYDAEELKPWARRAREIASASPTEDVYVVTNNHFQGKAIANALMLASMLERKKVPAPPPLFDHFEEQLTRYARPAQPRAHVPAG